MTKSEPGMWVVGWIQLEEDNKEAKMIDPNIQTKEE